MFKHVHVFNKLRLLVKFVLNYARLTIKSSKKLKKVQKNNSLFKLFFFYCHSTIKKNQREMSQTIGKAPDSIETVYDPDPVLKDWILVSAPDSSKLNAFKNRIVVNSPTPLNQRSTETIKVISQDKTKINDSVSDDEFPRQDIQDESIFNIHDQLGSTNKSNSFEESYTFSDSTQTQSSNKNTFTSTQTRQTTNTENSAPKATNRSVEPTAAKRVIPVVTTQTESSRRKLPVQVAPPSKSFFSGYSVTPNKRTLPVQTTTPNKRLSSAENAPPVKRVLPTQFYLSKSGPIKPPVNYTLESIKLYEALSDEQKKIHDIVMNEKSNIFFTGSAGILVFPFYFTK